MNVKSNRMLLKLLLLLFAITTSISAFSQQRLMEKIDRGVVAVTTDEGVFVGWRKFATDTNNVTYNVYRDNSLITSTPISVVSNYLDKEGTSDSYYFIEVLENSVSTSKTDAVVVWSDGYKEISLQLPDDEYESDDASVADLDGDGEYEIVVKLHKTHKDNSQSGTTDPVYLQAYKMNGTLMWSINLGINIRAGSHYNPFIVYDLDSDGKAELAVKTAPGTTDATGNYLSDGPAADDDDSADYRNSDGYIIEGPEYLTIFDGVTGEEVTTVEYVPTRGTVSDWGDSYGNRVDRFLACVAYFDTVPSLVMTRGYYTRSVLAAWDFKDGELTQRWVFDTDSTGTGKDGNDYILYAGQGAHSLSVGDVDADGFDEIVYGAMAVDHDGVGLWTTGNNHGDATHLGDFISDSAGLEYWMPSESAYSTNKVTGDSIPAAWLAHAATGKIIWQKDVTSSADVGRAMCDDITADNDGCEFWAASPIYNIYDEEGNTVDYSSEGPSINFGSWWDGDITREILSGNAIKKWSTTEKYSVLEPADCESNNSTKAVPTLSGDILGDWREEVIWRTADNKSLRIYTTTDTTEYGLYTLMQDPQYRLAIAWQNVGYNQPPHPSFFIGVGMDEPAVPSIKIIEPDVDASIEITNPSEGDTIALGTTLHTTLHMVGVSTTTVYLNNGETVIDTITGAPFVSELTDLESGSYELIAWCYNEDSTLVESAPINIYVDFGYPTVTLTSPEDGAVYDITDDITLSADASDSDGSITSVKFMFNNEVVATVTESPYTTTIDNPGYGSFDVVAVAIDNDENADTSAIHTIAIGDTLVIQESEVGYCGFLTSGYTESSNEGYTGDGYSNTANASGSGISWAIEVQTDGEYQFYWRYASEGDRPGKFTINDTIGGTTIAFATTDDSWTEWTMEPSEVYSLSAGKYELTLTATTSSGLGNIDYIKVLSFTEEGAVALECDSLSNSIDLAVASDNISLYPNPATETLNIKVLSGIGEIGSVSVYDITGKEIMTNDYSSSEVKLDISQINRGVYIVKVNSSLGICTKRLIVN